MKTNKNGKPGWAVAWAEYNHNERRGALSCGVLGVYATRDAARQAVMKSIVVDVENFIDDNADADSPLLEAWRGKTPDAVAQEMTEWTFYTDASVEFDNGVEYHYTITKITRTA